MNDRKKDIEPLHIHDLPDEILTHIFLYIEESAERDITLDVCKRWRDVIIRAFAPGARSGYNFPPYIRKTLQDICTRQNYRRTPTYRDFTRVGVRDGLFMVAAEIWLCHRCGYRIEILHVGKTAPLWHHRKYICEALAAGIVRPKKIFS